MEAERLAIVFDIKVRRTKQAYRATAGDERGDLVKLFVWRQVLCDYTCGIMVALAEDVEQARERIVASDDTIFNSPQERVERYRAWRADTTKMVWSIKCGVWDELEAEPEVYESEPFGMAVWGGG